jgi:hypothetical protein
MCYNILMYVKAYNPFSGESRPQSRLITFQLEEGETINALVGVDQPRDFIVPQKVCFFTKAEKPREEELVAEYIDHRKVVTNKKQKIGVKIWIVFILVEIVALYLELKLLGLI